MVASGEKYKKPNCKILKLSIIIPVYDAEKFLYKCLESVCNQDLPNSEYEIIIINDGSSDGSAKIIEDFQGKYSNVIGIKQENKGVSAARNAGLALAKGQMLFEDNYIFHEIFGNSWYQISLIEDHLYYYHYNSESITRKKFSLQRYDDHVSGLVRRKEFFLKEKKMYQAAAQTESMILDYMIINYLNNKEVQKNRLTIEYFLKNLLKSNVNYKTKIIIFSKLILNIDLFKSKFTPTK